MHVLLEYFFYKFSPVSILFTHKRLQRWSCNCT